MASHHTIHSDQLDAFRHWESSHKRLVASVGDYYNACTSLQSAYAPCPWPSHDKRAQWDPIQSLDLELPSLLLCKQKILSAHNILQSTRNMSRHMVLFNSFPPEILSNIFWLATRSCVKDRSYHKSNPRAVAGVCRYWRRIAMDTPSLWSHIDIYLGGLIDGGLYQTAELWLQRSKETPLHVHVREYEGYDFDHDELVDGTDVLRLLEPYINRISSLDLFWLDDSYDPDMYYCLLQALFNTGSPGILKSITLITEHKRGAQVIDFFEAGHWSPGHPNPLLLAVTTLFLRGVCFPFESGIFHGLTELRLSYTPITDTSVEAVHNSRTLCQLIKVLDASPNLRTLVLSHLALHSPTQNDFTPVHLNQLEHLNLKMLDPSSTCALLPYLVLGPGLLNLSLDVSDNNDSVAILLSFFKRTKVSTLYMIIFHTTDYTWLSLLSSPHTQLRRLVLVGLTIKKVDKIMGNSASRFMARLATLPSLSPIPELFLLYGDSDLDMLRKLLVACSVQAVHVWSPITTTNNAVANLKSTEAASDELARKIITYPDLGGWYSNPVAHWVISSEI